MIDDKEEQRNPKLAAKRELKEESGYTGEFRVIPAFVFKSPKGGFVYYNFIGLLKKEFEADLDWETEATKWMTLSELKSLSPNEAIT